MIKVEVAYAPSIDKQFLLTANILPNGTVEDAIVACGILEQCPDLALPSLCVGVFGQAAKLTTRLAAHDRVEIYRPLINDPKTQRRKRAKQS